MDITGSVVQYGDKKVIQGIFRNVREREIFEQMIIESRLKFRTLLDSIHDCVSLHDTNCEIKMANSFLAELMNLPVRDLIGKKCEDVYHCKIMAETCPVLNVRNSRRMEFSEMTIDGRIFQVWAYPM
ncbi:MAG: PAS domain-containing protein, partial [Nitrospinae bacterium]|nr:PAS domain-containing protein [Nitrospinota bacterium]